LTAKATSNDKIEGLKHGADYYLAKPFNPNELRAVAESLLTKKELEAELSKSNLELTNTLRRLEETQVQLVHAARLESIGFLAAGVAHEIKNNIYCVRAGLTGINKRLSLLSEGKIDIEKTYESLRKALETNDQAIDSSISVINSLLAFSGKEKEGMALFDINTGIENTLAILLPRIKDKLTVEKSLGETQKVECRIGEFNQVIMNIILNAYQAIEEKGKIHIQTTQVEDNVLISIADDGPGIPEEYHDKIFLPFFSTKEKEINTGLGLSICYNIIKNHHGTIDVKSNLGRGTEFIISLPNFQPDTET
jgi:signal transduction histidine kinase